MNKELSANDNNAELSKDNCSNALNKITSKSNNIKAKLKFKYLINKLERSFYNKKFI